MVVQLQLLERPTLAVAAAAALTVALNQVAMVVPVSWLSVMQARLRLLCLQRGCRSN